MHTWSLSYVGVRFLERRLGVAFDKKEDPAVNRRVKVGRLAWPLLAGLALVTLLAGVVSCGATGEQRAQNTAEGNGPEEPEAGADLDNPYLGDAGAPVVLIEYADFQ